MTTNTGYFLWLSELCGAGSSLPKRLYLAFGGNLKEAYEAPEEELERRGFLPEERELLSRKDFSAANRILDFCAEEHVALLTFASELYPPGLFAIDSPPPVLYARGQLHRLRENAAVTAVGSRNCSEAGYRAAYTLCYKLAGAGVTIVTGLAEGIDTACSLGALDSGGFSVGVLGSGINVLYPFENAPLFSRMFRSGVVLTEFSPFTQPLAKNFPIRNRILAALGDLCLVGEARSGSGSLITARDALCDGKPVFAIPSGIYDPRSAGTNLLLRSGARPATGAEDLLSELTYLYPESVKLTESRRQKIPEIHDMPIPRIHRKRKKAAGYPSEGTGQTQADIACASDQAPLPEELPEEESRSREEKGILLSLRQGEKTADMLARELDCSAGDILTALTMLEIEGTILSEPGGVYRLNR